MKTFGPATSLALDSPVARMAPQNEQAILSAFPLFAAASLCGGIGSAPVGIVGHAQPRATNRTTLRVLVASNSKGPTQLRSTRQESETIADEQTKLVSERLKLAADALKFERDRELAPWRIVLFCMAAGATCFGADAAFAKLMGL